MRERAAKGILRFIGSVAMVSGVLLLANVAITLLWQEPVSAFIGARQQARLDRELASTFSASTSTASVRGTEPQESRARRAARRPPAPALARRLEARAEPGDPLGRLELPALGKSFVFVAGTDGDSLREGPGFDRRTSLPGRGDTVALAGHRTTYGAPFRDVDQLERGDDVVVSMPYGRFSYRVERTEVVAPDRVSVLDDVGREQVVLIACHPPFSAAKRLVVFARLVGQDV